MAEITGFRYDYGEKFTTSSAWNDFKETLTEEYIQTCPGLEDVIDDIFDNFFVNSASGTWQNYPDRRETVVNAVSNNARQGLKNKLSTLLSSQNLNDWLIIFGYFDIQLYSGNYPGYRIGLYPMYLISRDTFLNNLETIKGYSFTNSIMNCSGNPLSPTDSSRDRIRVLKYTSNISGIARRNSANSNPQSTVQWDSPITVIPSFGSLGITTTNDLVFNSGMDARYFYEYISGSRVDVESYSYSFGLCSTGETPKNPSGTDTSTSGKYPSGEMGGLGTFDDTTDLSDISSKPSLNISDLGFFSIWNPSPAQLRNLADYVWNDPLNVQQWPQIFQSGILKPLDYIMSLSLFPLSPQQLSLVSKTFCMGGIVFDGRLSALGKNITMNQVTEQIIDVDMGTLSLKEYFGSFLDYSPYSQVSLYLPYYQTVQLSMNELQNADSINIRYRINLFDGSTSIKVHIDRQTSAAQNGSVPMKHVLYEFFTNLKTDIPLTSGQNTEQMKMLATVMAGAAAVVAAPIAGAGASALAGAAEGAATIGGMEGVSLGAQVGNSAVGQAVSGAIKTGAGAANKAINSLPSGGGIQRGNIGGMNNGLLSERRPFLIVTRPIQVLPLNYQGMEGYPASINTTLTALGEGFVKCESVDMTGLTATANEKGAILEALSGGVFI